MQMRENLKKKTYILMFLRRKHCVFTAGIKKILIFCSHPKFVSIKKIKKSKYKNIKKSSRKDAMIASLSKLEKKLFTSRIQNHVYGN